VPDGSVTAAAMAVQAAPGGVDKKTDSSNSRENADQPEAPESEGQQ